MLARMRLFWQFWLADNGSKIWSRLARISGDEGFPPAWENSGDKTGAL